jgi:hypothetical protein
MLHLVYYFSGKSADFPDRGSFSAAFLFTTRRSWIKSLGLIDLDAPFLLLAGRATLR